MFGAFGDHIVGGHIDSDLVVFSEEDEFLYLNVHFIKARSEPCNRVVCSVFYSDGADS